MKSSRELMKPIGAFMITLILTIGSLALIFPKPEQYSYSSSVYSVKMDSVIRHLVINGSETSAKYQVFQCEENHGQYWKLETPGHLSRIYADTLLTSSSLYTFDVLKKFTFREEGFTVNLSKTYLVSGFDENNQIIVDVHNTGFIFNATSFTFIGADWNMTIRIVSSNIAVTIQPPVTGGTELQFNFNGQSDEDIAYHQRGTIETVLFDVELSL